MKSPESHSNTPGVSRMHFKNGRKFRVIKEGARLTGFMPIAPYTQRGWSRALKVGDLITCNGSSMTRGDGVPALKWSDENGNWLANDCLFEPVQGGMWGGQIPADGFLEEVVSRAPSLRSLDTVHKSQEAHSRPLRPEATSADAFEFWKRYRPEAVKDDLRHRRAELEARKVRVDDRFATIISVGARAVIVRFEDIAPGTTP